jgi:hypothetical protein
MRAAGPPMSGGGSSHPTPKHGPWRWRVPRTLPGQPASAAWAASLSAARRRRTRQTLRPSADSNVSARSGLTVPAISRPGRRSTKRMDEMTPPKFILLNGTSHPVEAAKARTDRPVGGHGTTRPVPSTTSVLIRSDAAEGATLSSVLAPLGPVGEVNGERLSLREAARIKGVSIPTLRNAIDDGRLPAMRCVDHRGAGYSIDPIDFVNYQPLKLRKARSTRDRLCEACGAPFVSKRDDAIYCSTSCQKNGPRRRRRAAARAARAARLADLELRRRTQ